MLEFTKFVLIAVSATAIAAGVLTAVIAVLQKPLTRSATRQSDNYRTEPAIERTAAIPGRG
jgi:hypothetical protein